MKIEGVPRHLARNVAGDLELGLEWRGRYGIALRPLGERYANKHEQKTRYYDGKKQTRRKARIVCFHGHEAFIEDLLVACDELGVDVKITTLFATYTSPDQFDEIQDGVRAKYMAKYGGVDCTCDEAELYEEETVATT